MPARPLRVLLAQLGPDRHTRGLAVLAAALRDAGIEVIYGGPGQSPESVVASALEEGVDAVGISGLSAADTGRVSRVVELLRETGSAEVLVVADGAIPAESGAELLRRGVARLFTVGAGNDAIGAYLREWWAARGGAPTP